MNSGQVVEVFDGGWLALGEGLSLVRVMVVRHAAPAPGKDIPVGKRVGEWVYELFITTLSADGFLVEDVLDLYQGRGADRGQCWPMRMSKKIPIAGVPTPSVGKNSGKAPVNGCGTCAFPSGRRCRESRCATPSWAPPKEAPAVFVAADPPLEEYGPWQWAAAFGRATGHFGAEDARLARGWKTPLPSRSQPVVE